MDRRERLWRWISRRHSPRLEMIHAEQGGRRYKDFAQLTEVGFMPERMPAHWSRGNRWRAHAPPSDTHLSPVGSQWFYGPSAAPRTKEKQWSSENPIASEHDR